MEISYASFGIYFYGKLSYKLKTQLGSGKENLIINIHELEVIAGWCFLLRNRKEIVEKGELIVLSNNFIKDNLNLRILVSGPEIP